MGVLAHGNSSSFAGQGLSNPELTDLASLTGQLALGILRLCFKEAKITGGLLHCPESAGIMGIRTPQTSLAST